MIKLAFILLLNIVLIACTSDKNREAQDFGLLCDQFTALLKADGYTNMTSEKRADVLEEMLVEVLAPTSNAYIAWTAIRYATPSARAALFDEAAHSSGYKDWGCSAINEHGHEVGSSHE